MRQVLIIALLSLGACRSLEHTSEQCSPYFVYTDETQKLIDADKSSCFCRSYRFSADYIGAITGSGVAMPLNHCNKIVGFKDYAETATFWERVRVELKNKSIELMTIDNE